MMTQVAVLSEPLALTTKACHLERLGWRDVLLIALCLLIFGISGYSFAHRQTLWLDETTQLSGLTLGPIGVTKWLVGIPLPPDLDFGIPTAPDRMPPISYYLGQLWSVVFGYSEISLRYFGLVCVGGTICLVYDAVRRLLGSWQPALAAALYIALSPAILERAVEIRAYPLYLMVAAMVVWATIGYLRHNILVGENNSQKGKWLWPVLLTTSLILMVYTHFIGLLGAGVVLTALIFLHWSRSTSVRPVILMGVAFTLAATGLYPFVMASIEVSRSGMQWTILDRVIGLNELMWYLMSHRLASFDSWLPKLVVLCCGGWLLPLIFRRRFPDEVVNLTRFVGLISLGMGFLILTVGTYTAQSFKAGQYQYNLWMVPWFAVLLGIAVYHSQQPERNRLFRWFTGCVVVLFLLTNAWTNARIAFGNLERNNIAHGPDPKIAAIIADLGSKDVTVYHEAGSNNQVVQLYYPICYLFNGKIPQYTYEPEKSATSAPNSTQKAARDFVLFENGKGRTNPTECTTRYAMVIRSVPLSSEDYAGLPMQACIPGPAYYELRQAGWKLLTPEPRTYRGMMRQDTWVFVHP